MIAVRAALGVRRQVFLITVGGFDTHSNQKAVLPGLFRGLSQSIGAFQTAMGLIGETERVTGFSHSEFGRTLSSSSAGSDHGWGGHSFCFGGDVIGKDIYGEMPDLTLEGPDDLGQGRLIPKLAVDQYAGTLAKWFGLTDSEIDLVLPNLNRFTNRDLGFLNMGA